MFVWTHVVMYSITNQHEAKRPQESGENGESKKLKKKKQRAGSPVEETRSAAVWGKSLTGLQLVMEGPSAAGAETVRVKLCLTGANCLRGANTTCHYRYGGAAKPEERNCCERKHTRTHIYIHTYIHTVSGQMGAHSQTHTIVPVRIYSHTHRHDAYTAGTQWQVHISAGVPSAHREAANSLWPIFIQLW